MIGLVVHVVPVRETAWVVPLSFGSRFLPRKLNLKIFSQPAFLDL
jgi:hypothetical protein